VNSEHGRPEEAPLPSPGADGSAPPRRGWRRFLPIALLIAAALTAVGAGGHSALSWDRLIREWVHIEGFIAAHPVSALCTYVAVYAAATGIALPGALFLTLAGGLLFGPYIGGAAALAAATMGATVVFLATRTAFGSLLARRAGSMATRLARGFRRDAFFYLLFLRLAPAFPFYLVNLVPAFCNVRLKTFLAATILGMAPASFALAFIGAGLDHLIDAHAGVLAACEAAGRTDCAVSFDGRSLLSPQVMAGIVALAVLTLVPILVRRLLARRRMSTEADGIAV
jgi:uncharacterized membrane protein YdjX (TVP38/TMEM64 family)